MKCKNGVMPEQVEVRPDGKNALVVLCENIESITTTTDEGTITEYVYDRYTLNAPNRANLFDDVADNFASWLVKAKQTEYDKLSADVRAKRNELLAETDKEFVLDRINLNIPQKVTASSMLNVFKDILGALGSVCSSDMAKYRQALRDIPQQKGFPYIVDFPNKPQ